MDYTKFVKKEKKREYDKKNPKHIDMWKQLEDIYAKKKNTGKKSNKKDDSGESDNEYLTSPEITF